MSIAPNKHYAEAEKVGVYYSNKHVADDTDVIALGQVEATLALAYEQRTANLIAYQSNVERSYFQTLAKPRSGQANELNRTIIERPDLA